MQASTIQTSVAERIGAQPASVWTPADFLDLGKRDAVDKALQRLAHAGTIRRVQRGLYDIPRVSTLTRKATVPDYRAIIDAVARRVQAPMLIDGLTAANDLGLSDAVPARMVVHTGARLRPMRVGNLKITFRPTTSRKLYWASRPAMRIVQALYWLRGIVPQNRDRIIARLRAIVNDPSHGAAIRADLQTGLATLPAWMREIVQTVLAPEPAHAKDRTA